VLVPRYDRRCRISPILGRRYWHRRFLAGIAPGIGIGSDHVAGLGLTYHQSSLSPWESRKANEGGADTVSSTFTMRQFLHRLKDHVDSVLSGSKKPKTLAKQLSAERKDVSQLIQLLAPFAEAVRHWEGEKYVSLSLVWPLTQGLFHFLQGLAR